MLNAFLKYIKQNILMTSKHTLIGVSGGRDSVVLCELYHQADLPFAIAHCNFNLRAEESDGDAKFVKELAKKYGVVLHQNSCLTKEYASEKGISIQMAARNLRFEWFRLLLKENNYKYYATAHHQDDAIETYLINQIRGTGIAGLHGILPKVGNLIHPLLFASRDDIDEYVAMHHLKYREDSSNASTKYIRNKVRHDLMPVFLEINPQIRDIFSGNMTRMNAIEQIFNIKIDEIRNELLVSDGENTRIKLSPIFSDDYGSTLLYELIKEFDFNFTQCTQMLLSLLKHESGAIFYSQNYRALLDRGELIIEKNKEIKNEIISVNEGSDAIEHPFPLLFEKSDNLEIISSQKMAQLDYAKLVFPLKIRRWEKGDYFFPLGIHGKKLLSDFFIDQKLSLFEKEEVFLLCSNNDIVWVIGYRIDDRYKLTKKSKSVLKVTMD